MRILTLVQGTYGQRIFEHIKAFSPRDWEIEATRLPPVLPFLIDEPGEFLPSEATEAELLLGLIESEGAAQLLPALAKLCHARAVIVPVDNGAWLPPGLQSQVRRELEANGTGAVFPRTFCTLTESNTGFRSRAVSYNDRIIAAFARHFGRPRLRLTVDQEQGRIKSVAVERGSPCGSTQHAAGKIVGMPVAEVIPLAGLLVHQFPCLASMQTEEIEDGIFEPLMSISGHVMNEELERKLVLLIHGWS